MQYQVGDSTECINCGADIHEWYDDQTKESYWATANNISTCGRSADQHIPFTR